MLRIASVDNISARAYGLVPPSFPAELAFMTPANVYDALESGQYDAALLPVGSLPFVQRDIETIGAFGIACTGAVSSVLLCCEYPLAQILHTQAPIYVSEKSRTSRELLTVLCRDTYNCTPKLTTDPDKAVAKLYIGEDALIATRDSAWQEVVDMGEWWHEMTNLPFVFARWVVRQDLPTSSKEQIDRWLLASVDKATSPQGRRLLAEQRHATLRTKDSAIDYYTRIRTRLSCDDLAGMTQFLERIEEHAACRLTA